MQMLANSNSKQTREKNNFETLSGTQNKNDFKSDGKITTMYEASDKNNFDPTWH